MRINFSNIELQGLFEKVDGLKAIVRVMPNTPALVGAGCAGIFRLYLVLNMLN